MNISVLEEMRPIVDLTIEKLKAVNFKSDPIVDPLYSRIFSLVGSSQKRHGFILERAIEKALKKYPQYNVWNEPHFKVSHRVNGMISTVNKVKTNPDWLDLLENNLDYGDAERTQQVDLVAYNHDEAKIIALEIKRGYGNHDAGKKKKILQDILATKLLLKSYGMVDQKLKVKVAKAYICCYYGSDEFNKRISISKNDLDKVFGVEVLKPVEEVNHYYRKCIRALGHEWISSGE